MALDKQLAHRLKLEYFERIIAGRVCTIPLVDLVTVKHDSQQPSKQEEVCLDTNLVSKIEKLCNESALPAYSFYLTVLSLLVNKYNNDTSLLVATSGFMLKEEDQSLQDHFTLINSQVDPHASFKSNYFAMKKAVIKAYAYQGVSYEKFCSCDPDRLVYAAFTSNENNQLLFADRFDLHMHLDRHRHSLVLNYTPSKFSIDFISVFLNNYIQLLNEFSDNLDKIPEACGLLIDYRKNVEIMQAEEGDFNFDF